jgi:hypothetical protein
MIQPCFNYSNVVKMIPIFDSKTHTLVDLWNQQINASTKKEISVSIFILYHLYYLRSADISEVISSLGLDIIGLAIFGYNFNALYDPEGIMYKTYKVVMSNFQVRFRTCNLLTSISYPSNFYFR